MQTKPYSDLYNLIVALSGVGSFTTEEKNNILQFVNRRAFEAYRASPSNRNSALEYEFYVDSNGAHVINLIANDSSKVFVNYQKELPVFTQDSTDIPQEFFFFLGHAAYADFLRMDGQHNKSMQEEQLAGTYLALELEKIDLRSNNNTINKKFSTYVNRQSR